MTQLTLGRVAALTLVFALAACQTDPPAPAPKPTPRPAPWVRHGHVGGADAAALLAEQPAVRVLDVRTPPEFLQGHIAGAVNVDFKDPGFSAALAELMAGVADMPKTARSGFKSAARVNSARTSSRRLDTSRHSCRSFT